MLASDTLCLSCCFFIVSRANLLEGPMWYIGVSFHKLTSLLFMMVSLFSLDFNVPLITFGLSIWAECVATFLQCVWNFLEIYFTLHDVGPFPKLYALGLHKKLALIIIDEGACQSVPTNVEFDFLLYPKRCRMDRSPGEMGYTAVKYDSIETCSYLSRNERAQKLCVTVLPTTLWVFGKQK